MRAAVRNKVREYRLELWLFFGVPIVGMVVSSLVLILITTLVSGNYGWSALPFSIANLALLAISYRWVSRLPRVLLKLMWQYSLVVGVVAIIFNVIQAGVHGAFYAKSSVTTFTIYIALLGLVQAVVGLAILVGFARQASGEGFHKVLVLIGVIAFPGVNLLASIDGARFGYEIGVLAVKVLLSVVAIWALHSTDAGKSVGRKGLVALFGSAMVAYASPYVALDIENSFLYETPILSTFYIWIFYVLPMVVAYGITILAAYMIRVRLPKQEPPPEEPVDSSTLLYGGGWRDSS